LFGTHFEEFPMRPTRISCRPIFLAGVVLGASLGLEAESSNLATVRAEPPSGPTAKEFLEKGPFQLRALEPSERPWLSQLVEPKRFAALRAARDVSIFAARGERESFGVVVMGLAGHALRAKVTDLEGPGGARIPCSEIRVRWAESVQPGGAVPDPLLEEQPFQPPRGIAPMLWVTISVPRAKTPAGTYRAILTAESNGRAATLPFTLEVFDFALPEMSYLKTSFWLFRHTVRNYYGLKSVPFEHYRKYLDRCLEARLSPIDAAEFYDQPFRQVVRDEKGELQVDWTESDHYLAYCLERGMTAFHVGDLHFTASYFRSLPVRDLKTGKTETLKLTPDSQQYADTVKRFFRLAREHYTKRGWADRAYLQGHDEPDLDPKLLAEIRRFYELAREGWPGLRTLITAPPQTHTALHKSVGIWCPLTIHYTEAEADKRRQQGEEVWWYVCSTPTAPWANFWLDQPGAAHRVLFWQTFARRADGLLYWGANHWPAFDARTAKPAPAEKRWPAAPWGDHGRNGDGYLLYPGPDGPLTSLRLEIIRDGVEDYDALRMLEELLRQKGDRVPAAVRERARQALTVSPEVFASMTRYPADAGAMVKRRRAVNELIVVVSNVKAGR
jgi:hypothetical protein